MKQNDKIYIYEYEALNKTRKFRGTECYLVKLLRPEGLEEHQPKKGDIIKITLPNNCFTNLCVIESKTKDGNYWINFNMYDVYDEEVKDGKYIDIIKDISDRVYNDLKEAYNIKVEDNVEIDDKLGCDIDISGDLMHSIDNEEDAKKFIDYLYTEMYDIIANRLKEEQGLITTNKDIEINLYKNKEYITEYIDLNEYIRTNKRVIKERTINNYRMFVYFPIYKK